MYIEVMESDPYLVSNYGVCTTLKTNSTQHDNCNIRVYVAEHRVYVAVRSPLYSGTSFVDILGDSLISEVSTFQEIVLYNTCSWDPQQYPGLNRCPYSLFEGGSL